MMRSHNLSSICQTCLSLLALKEIAMLPRVFVRKEIYLSYSHYPNYLYNQQFRNGSSHLIIYRFKSSSNNSYRIWFICRGSNLIYSATAIWNGINLYTVYIFVVRLEHLRISKDLKIYKKPIFASKKRSNVIVIGFQAKKKNRLSTFQYVTESSQHMSIFN